MIRLSTALVVVGALLVILGAWMKITQTPSADKTLGAGLVIEALGVIFIIVRYARRKKAG